MMTSNQKKLISVKHISGGFDKKNLITMKKSLTVFNQRLREWTYEVMIQFCFDDIAN